MNSRLTHFPVSAFSISLGLAGFSLALSRAEMFIPLTWKASMYFRWIAAAAFVFTGLIYLSKLLKYPASVKEELQHPVRMNFFPLIAKLFLVFSIIFLTSHENAARGLWYAGVTVQVIATWYILSSWIHCEKFNLSHISPANFMPIIGNMLIPIAGVHFAPKEVNWFFFSIGIVFWIVMFTIVINRIFFHTPVPEKLLPTMFILMAPPAIGMVAYIQLTHSIDAFTRIQYYFALFMAILLLSQFREFARLKFYLSWWAYTFPLAAVTTASFVLWHKTEWYFLMPVGCVLLSLLALIIIVLIVITIRAIMRREICQPE